MVRESYIQVGALNIAMHTPHSPNKYLELFNDAYELKKIVSSRSENGALIGSLYLKNQARPENGLMGEIYQFIQLDASEPWFDLDSKDEASPDDVRKIVIPDNLKPNLTRFPFVFFPKGHRLFIQEKVGQKKLSMSTAQLIFNRIFSADELSTYGEIEITVEPTRESIESIFQIKTLNRLEIELVRPNPDDHDEAERKLLEKLEKQNAKVMQITLMGGRNAKITPDDETKTIAKIAASNGFVSANGWDELDQKVEISTKNHPWVERVYFNPSIQTSNDVLFEVASSMHLDLSKQKNV